ncbi:MAG TPA: hypothetical protein VLV78_22370 [Thermoanaerobaculia bacterium]|nr:hypothetical protein [Thermoanaerobaculia bacterium]
MPQNPRNRAERRKKQRIQLTRGVLARYGATPVIILDITDAGARIEHFVRFDVGRRSRLRLEWREKPLEVDALVVSCRVHRFAHGEEGTTVYQSGLFFHEYIEDALNALRDLVATHVAHSLAEQVANARGIGPVIEQNMPVFRSGVVATTGIEGGQKSRRMIPTSSVVIDRGYLRCTMNGNRWDKKWSRSPDQPEEEGFTVLATEPAENVDQLCDTYQSSNAEGRELIRKLAQISVERSEETPEPK